MTATPHEARQAELLAAVQPFADRATRKVLDRVDDARAHAGRALTKSAIAEADGRATIRRVDWSPSYGAAVARLEELLDLLAGPFARSLDGIVRDAFVAAYRDSYRYWRDALPESILAPGRDVPSKADLARVRATAVLGYDPRDYLSAPIDQAGRRLKALLASLASPTLAARDRSDSLDAWARTTAEGLSQRTGQLIRTGAFYLDRVAGRDAVRPELLHDDPTLG